MFRGSIVALITPMRANGDLDIENLRELVEIHIEKGTDAIVVLGSTGEAATLSYEERNLVIKNAVEQSARRIPIIAGSGTNCTRETVELTRNAMYAGADACLVVTPYYNKPTQEGLFLHFRAVADAVPIPQILYNVPSRTCCDLLPETVERLSTVPNIIGLKDATGDLKRAQQLLETCGERLNFYSGDDSTAMEYILLGGKGVISITANIVPAIMHNMCKAALAGDRQLADKLNDQIKDLHKQVLIETNPIPAKWLLHEMGLIPEGIRLPLTPLSTGNRKVLREVVGFVSKL